MGRAVGIHIELAPEPVTINHSGGSISGQTAIGMDQGKGQQEASLVKLLACRTAEWVTREAVQVHGGMGYAEETPVSRYFVDARVLSIFEGAEETLAVRVIGKDLAKV